MENVAISVWTWFRTVSIEFWIRLFYLLDLALGIYGPYVELALVSLVINFAYNYKMWKAEEVGDRKERMKLKIAYSAVYAMIYISYILWKLFLTDAIQEPGQASTTINSEASTHAKKFPIDGWVLLIVFGIMAFTLLPLRISHLSTISVVVHAFLLGLAFALDYYLYGWNPLEHPWEIFVLVIFMVVWRYMKKEVKLKKSVVG